MKLDHFQECSKFQSKLFVNNDMDTEPKLEQGTDSQELVDEFNTLVDRFKTTCFIDYFKMEYITK